MDLLEQKIRMAYLEGALQEAKLTHDRMARELNGSETEVNQKLANALKAEGNRKSCGDVRVGAGHENGQGTVLPADIKEDS